MSATEQPRALITGLSGFTGRYMAAELRQRGYEIWGIDEPSTEESLSIRADLTDRSSLCSAIAEIKPNLVVHLAGIAFVGPTPEQMLAFGLKHRARALAEQAGVPLLPGTDLLKDLSAAQEAA